MKKLIFKRLKKKIRARALNLIYHPSMKSRALVAAFRWCLASENGTIQCDTNVIPIVPFCDAFFPPPKDIEFLEKSGMNLDFYSITSVSKTVDIVARIRERVRKVEPDTCACTASRLLRARGAGGGPPGTARCRSRRRCSSAAATGSTSPARRARSRTLPRCSSRARSA